MGILVIPSYTSAIKSMVRLPDSGWDTSLPSSVLDLSRSSSLAAVVQVTPTPFITRNTVGAAANATENTANVAKLSETDPHRRTREEHPKRPEGSDLSPAENAPTGRKGTFPSTTKEGAFPKKSDAKVDGRLNGNNQASLHMTSQSEILKRLKSYQTSPREATSAKRFKTDHSTSTQIPSSVYMITVSSQTSGAMMVQNVPQAAALMENGTGSQQTQLGLLTRLQREAQELRAVNNQLKQRLINYQNLFKDKQKLRTLFNIIYKNQPQA